MNRARNSNLLITWRDKYDVMCCRFRARLFPPLGSAYRQFMLPPYLRRFTWQPY